MLSVLALALATVTAPSAALAPKGPWLVDGEEGLCILGRQFDAPGGTLTLAFEPVPTQDLMEVRMQYSGTGLELHRYGTASFMLSDGSATKVGYTSFPGETPQQGRFVRFTISRQVYDRLLQSRVLTIAAAGQQLVLATGNAAPAVEALHQCETALLQHWGIDPVAFAAVVTPPRAREVASWFSYSSYPRDALERDAQGRVVLVAPVDAAGKVTGCKVISSAGDPALDRWTCLIVQRHQVQPGRNAAGQPVASWLILAIRLIMPSD